MSQISKKITTEEIILIHNLIVAAIGGSLGVREPNLLESISQKPFGHYFDKELYPGVFLKAAVIFESLANYHVFVDGNKRTAIATLEYFLNKHGYILQADKEHKEQFILNTAQAKNPELAEIATWIKQHADKEKE